MHKVRRLLLTIAALFVAGGLLLPADASALSGGDFQAGRIMDDTMFFNPNTLSTSEIQTFLNAKVPSCDTNGTQPYSGTTRAAYGSSRGYPPPYTCLKDYRANTVSKSAESGLCNGYSATNQSAAEIIFGVAQSCGVSPRVLVVLLQKEQGLITDDWPWSIQYRSATGYGCPDTAPCDAEYYGFFNQVYAAARQFKRYARNAGDYNYQASRNNFIQYNPSGSCGGSTIFVHNQATAGLYNYTPYQPNQPALNNLYGTGDSCSAYGNRNFWRYYNDWFGSTHDPFDDANIRLTTPLTITPNPTLYQNQTYTASFQITNTANYPINIGVPMVSVRGPQGQNLDIPGDNVTIAASSTYTYSKQWSTPVVGWHQFNLVLYKPGLGFSFTAPAGNPTSTSRQVWLDVKTNPSISSNLTVSPAQPHAGQNYTVSFNIRNSTAQAVNVGRPFVIVRGPQGQNLDVPVADSDVIIPGNSTYNYSKQWLSTAPGRNTFTIAFYKPGQGTSTTQPGNDNGIARSINVTVLENPTLTGALTLPTEIIAGVPYTASFVVTNHGSSAVNIGSPFIVVRGPQGQNLDIPGDNVTIPANSTYTFNKQWVTPLSGWHEFTLVTYRPGLGFSYTYPLSLNNSLRQTWINVKPNVRITSPASTTPTQPIANQSYTATFTVRNDSSEPKDIGYPFIIVRGPQGQNRDIPVDSRVTIPANSTYTYSKQWLVTEPGAHTFTLATWMPGQGILTNFPAMDTGVPRTVTITAQP